MFAAVLRRPVAGLFFVCLLLLAWPGAAEVVRMTAPNGRVATAEYQPGRPELPAVMIIHGFLQTREFSTVAALADALVAAGYTVLRPTLTLNVSSRRRSLPCEAVHTHTFGMDVDEVGAWTEWLSGRGHRLVVLVGHSSGAAAILPHLPHPHPAFGGAFLIGLPDPDRAVPEAERRQLVRELRARIARRDRALVVKPHSFCRRYVSTPEGFLSFLQVDRQRIFAWLAHRRVPVMVVLAGADERTGEDWAALLKRQGVTVEVIAEATHFFEGVSEFELHDRVLRFLAQVRGR